MDSEKQDSTIDAEVKDPVAEEVVDVSDTVGDDGAAKKKDAELTASAAASVECKRSVAMPPTTRTVSNKITRASAVTTN